jgi:hypothetical protein
MHSDPIDIWVPAGAVGGSSRAIALATLSNTPEKDSQIGPRYRSSPSTDRTLSHVAPVMDVGHP